MPTYRASDSIACEILDGEAIVIDLVSGAYFSFTGSTTWAWESLVAGVDSQTLGESFADVGGVEGFVAELVDAGLLAGRLDLPPTDAPVQPDGLVEPLVFDRFDDLADMIKLDPVHDVSREAGWPRPADG